MALTLTGAIQRVNQLLGRQDETGPYAMHMLARKGGYSIAKARRLLGFAPKVDLATSIKKFEAWLREIGAIK